MGSSVGGHGGYFLGAPWSCWDWREDSKGLPGRGPQGATRKGPRGLPGRASGVCPEEPQGGYQEVTQGATRKGPEGPPGKKHFFGI